MRETSWMGLERGEANTSTLVMEINMMGSGRLTLNMVLEK